MRLDLPLVVLLTAVYAVGGANGYCCFIVSMLESSGLPSEFVGQFVRNPSGMEKINDHLFWRNREDESQLVFWDSRIQSVERQVDHRNVKWLTLYLCCS